ncbi:hypothetical protein J2X84_003959 [Pseudomonas corrugata]|nr:hypothetical protein [Pseudomonas corrugata]
MEATVLMTYFWAYRKTAELPQLQPMLVSQFLRQMRGQIGSHLGIRHGPVRWANTPSPQVSPNSCGSGLAREAIC